MLQSGQAFELE